MEKYFFNLDKKVVLEVLAKEISDPEMVKKMANILERLSLEYMEERRERQVDGINKARRSGVALGRPKLKEPENFREVVDAWMNKKVGAVVAAQMCGMKISTFYRRAREIKEQRDREVMK